jgi:hypothetical protein
MPLVSGTQAPVWAATSRFSWWPNGRAIFQGFHPTTCPSHAFFGRYRHDLLGARSMTALLPVGAHQKETHAPRPLPTPRRRRYMTHPPSSQQLSRGTSVPAFATFHKHNARPTPPPRSHAGQIFEPLGLQLLGYSSHYDIGSSLTSPSLGLSRRRLLGFNIPGPCTESPSALQSQDFFPGPFYSGLIDPCWSAPESRCKSVIPL